MNQYFFPILTFVFLFLPAILSAETRLSVDGVPYAVIVLSDSPTPVERTAARELKEHLDLMTGGSFPVVSLSDLKDSELKVETKILVGDSPRIRELLPDFDPEKLGYDGIRVKTVGDSLILAGHPKRGTLYAVYSLLEDQLGVHWWSDSERTVPRRSTVVLPPLDVTYAPKLKLREAHYRVGFDGVFQARLRQNVSSKTHSNGNRSVIPPEYGGSDHLLYFKTRNSAFHSFYVILPPAKYFKDHPEWYSEINGKRTFENAQLCLTNEEMLREYVKNTLELIEQEPGAKYVSVTQNDWGGNCQCAKCRAIDEENGSPSGTMIHFCNRVAEEIQKVHPEVYVDTLAYQYTLAAPKKVRPNANVVVRLCSMGAGYLHPMETRLDPANEDFLKALDEWAAITEKLIVWQYTTCFMSYMIPYPNMRGLIPDLRFFIKKGAYGYFAQGDAFCVAGDFVRLRNWLLSRLMWNPDLDEREQYDLFMRGYYGDEAGPILQKYLKLIHDRAQKTKVHLHCYEKNVLAWMDLETFNEAMELMDQATAAAERQEKAAPVKYAGTVERIRRDRIPMDLTAILYYYRLKTDAELAGKPFNGPKDPEAALENLVKLLHELNVERCVEWGDSCMLDPYCAFLRKTLQTEKKVYEKCKAPVKPDPFVDAIPAESRFDAQESAMTLREPGKWTELAEDPAASNGLAGKLLPNHTVWAIHVPVPKAIYGLKPVSGEKPGEKPDKKLDGKPNEKSGEKSATFHIYAWIRCETTTPESPAPAFQLGVFDPAPWQSVFMSSIPMKQTTGKMYTRLDLGTHDLPETAYFWVAPMNQPEKVSAIYLDRVLFVRE